MSDVLCCREIIPELFESCIHAYANFNGLDYETAAEAMACIRDTPVIDDQGRAYVQLDDGRELWLLRPRDDVADDDASDDAASF